MTNDSGSNLFWDEPIEVVEMNCFLRDLTPSHILNPSELFDTAVISTQEVKKKNKADLMREQISQERQLKKKQAEFDIVSRNINLKKEDALDMQMCALKSITQKEVRREALIQLLGVALTQKLWHDALSIYLVLEYESPITDKERKHDHLKWAREVFKKKKIDPVEVQFTGAVDVAPMNKFLTGNIRLDPWQKQVLSRINEGVSPLVVAPTSCGKTQLALYQVQKANRVMIVEPTPALVFEVAAIVRHLIGNHVCVIAGNSMIQFSDDEPRVWIGTAPELEVYLVKNDILMTMDYAIFDEIHCLNDPSMGASIERLLYAIPCPFIALSATIDLNSAQEVVSYWSRRMGVHRPIELFVHTERYLNLGRWVFQDGKLVKIHPLASMTVDDLRDDEKFKLLDFSLTPQDSWALYQSILELDTPVKIETDHLKIYPDVVLLHLDDTRKMEASLKNDLRRLALEDPEAVEAVLIDFKLKKPKSTDFHITELAMSLKAEKKTPAIIFVEDAASAIDQVQKLVIGLEKAQEVKYPDWHHEIERRQARYAVFQEALESIRKTKISQTGQFKTREDIENAIERRTREEQESPNGQATEVDPWSPHPDFVMSPGGPIHDSFIKKARITLSKASKMRIGYENILIRALRLGIAVFTQDMSESEKDLQYQLLVQDYAQHRRLGIIFSDKHTLAFGINMPIRTTVLLTLPGYEPFAPLLAHQMMGRAGRRGYDKEGHVIYAGTNPLRYIKKEYGQLKGQPHIWYDTFPIAQRLCGDYVNRLNAGGCLQKPDFDPMTIQSIEMNEKWWSFFRVAENAAQIEAIASKIPYKITDLTVNQQACWFALFVWITGVKYQGISRDGLSRQIQTEVIEHLKTFGIDDCEDVMPFVYAYTQFRCPDEGITTKEVEMATLMHKVGQLLVDWSKEESNDILKTIFARVRDYTLKYRTLQYLK